MKCFPELVIPLDKVWRYRTSDFYQAFEVEANFMAEQIQKDSKPYFKRIVLYDGNLNTYTINDTEVLQLQKLNFFLPDQFPASSPFPSSFYLGSITQQEQLVLYEAEKPNQPISVELRVRHLKVRNLFRDFLLHGNQQQALIQLITIFQKITTKIHVKNPFKV